MGVQAIRVLAELLAVLPPTQSPRLHGCEGGTLLGAPCDDSRALSRGGTFVAVANLRRDGHAFLAAAVAAGAGLLIVQREHTREHAQLLANHPHVELEDSAGALALLAAGWNDWPGEALQLAGVTGTNGKTTTAHLVGAVLRRAQVPHLRLGTTGNWLVDHESQSGFTTPFPLELHALLADARGRGAAAGVMEVSSHALAQGRAQPLRFRASALTSFSQDHLDFHPDMGAYLDAKCLLARRHTHPEGVAVAPLSQGEASARFLAAAADAGVSRRWRCARHPLPLEQAEIAVTCRLVRATAGISARVRTPAGELELRSPLVGEFNLDNLLVAVALCLALGLDLDQIGAGLAHAQGAPGRLEAVSSPTGAGPAVYVDYAHTPDAVERALEALRPHAEARGGALIVVLGCGGDRDPSKRPLMGEIASRAAELFYATSDNPRGEDPATIVDQMVAGARPRAGVIVEVDRGAAILRAITEARPQDLVLIAGKGHEDYQILGERTIHFDDREHALAALSAAARDQ